MILYVRQQAFYNAVPDGSKLTRAEQIERGNEFVDNNSDDDSDELDSDEEEIPAVQERQEIPMPEIPPGSEYLVAFLHSAGTASSSGMGLTGLSWQEIESWAKCTDNIGIATPRDLKMIHTLSRVYANEFAAASKKGAQPPFIPKVVLVKEMRDYVSKKADDLFGSLMAAQSYK